MRHALLVAVCEHPNLDMYEVKDKLTVRAELPDIGRKVSASTLRMVA